MGAFHPLTKTPQESVPKPAPLGDPPGIDFFANNSLGISASSVNEPSGGAGGGVVFVSANWFAAYSTDGGAHYTQLDPTTIFPNNGGGFCCDQIVQYVSSIDRIIWLMQYGNVMRIASASPADIISSNGTAWTYWDITASQLGFGTSQDYPDMSVGDNSLYLSFDEGPGLVVVRIPLTQIRDSQTIFFQYTDPNNSTMAYFGHLTQNTQDEIFWGGHNSNSNMRIFSWQEGSNTYFWRDIGVGSWPNNSANMTSISPDGQDWLTKLRQDDGTFFLIGATRVFTGFRGKAQQNQIWFTWTAPSGNQFPQPHVQWVAFDRDNNFNLITQQQIWNSNYAFAYPALSSNSNGEVGLSLEYGGGGNYENHVVGFWGDFVVYITTSSNTGVSRYGDYVTIRRSSSNPARFDAFGYGMLTSGGGAQSDTHYVVFGRP